MPSGVLISEAPSGAVVFWNEQATRTWPDVLPLPSGLSGLRRCRVIDAEGRPYTADRWPLTRVLRTGEAVTAERVEFIHDDGGRTVMDVRCAPVHTARGDLSAAVAILQDVTDRTRAEQALEASRARYENLYQDAPDMFASVDVDTQCLVQCNQTLVSTTGFSRRELLGRPLQELHDPECWSDLQTALAVVERSGRVRDSELRLLCKNGTTLDVSLSVAAIRDERGSLYYRSTWRDITDRTRAQAALERSRVELQRLAGQLLTAQEDERRRISRELHDDLNQRLALLSLDLDSLAQQLPDSRDVILSRLHELRERVVQLSDDVHSLAYQLHTPILDDVGLVAALQSHVSEYQTRNGMRVDLKLDPLFDTVPPEVATCLYRVAQEALLNVAKHADTRHARVALKCHPDGIKLVVVDSGLGFDIRGGHTHGSGLGIVGMQERVRQVGGRFRLHSQPRAGTTIEVWVPIDGTRP